MEKKDEIKLGKVKRENNFENVKNKKFAYYNPDKEKFYEENNNNLRFSNSGKEKIPLFSFSSEKGLENFKIRDLDAAYQRKEKILSGEMEKNVFETLNNFTPEEVETKTFFMMKIANNEENRENIYSKLEEYNGGFLEQLVEKKAPDSVIDNIRKQMGKQAEKFTDKEIVDRLSGQAKVHKKFFDTYELLESFSDEPTGVSGYIVGNRKTGKTEIFFAGSNDPTTFFKSSETRKDWGNNGKSAFTTPPNYKKALEIAKKYKNGYGNYEPLDVINGHSKGGGEAIYVASYLNVKALVNDPAPVVNPGPYINSNKILALIPNNGEGTLNRAVNIPGSNFYTLEAKTGVRQGNGKFKTTNITAVPTPSFIQGKGLFKSAHFSDPIGSAQKLKEMKEYAKNVKNEYENFQEEKKKTIMFSSNEKDLGKEVKALKEKEKKSVKEAKTR